MDGIQEASHCNDGTVCSGSVACTVALLGTLEELSRGVGLTEEHIEAMEKMKEPDYWTDHYKENQGKILNSKEFEKSYKKSTIHICKLNEI